MNIFNTLYSKLALTLVGLLLIVGVFYALLSQSLLHQSYQSSNQQLNQNLASDLVREMKLIKDGRIDQNSMHDAFGVMMLVNPSIEIYFLDMKGKIVSFSADKKLIKRHTVDLNPVRQFLDGSASFPLLGDDPRSNSNRKPFSVTPLPNASNTEGYLYVVLQGSQYDQIQTQEQFRTLETLGFTALGGSLGIGLVIGLFLFYRLTRRIRRLNQSMDRFRGNELMSADEQIQTGNAAFTRGDEINQLSNSFDAMAKRIDDQVDQLEAQDNLRREMVANISHDLRTPLAAIHGYIERLKTHFDDLSVEERNEFLDISFHHSNRLNHMIGALFELSKLEAKEATPEIEAFSISELGQDVVQKFKFEAEKKSIQLTLVRGDNLPLVNGDIAMIDRALSNLVDNAITCTAEGGEVQLVLSPEERTISIEVKDNGKGIDEKFLPTLFQRFYQADSRRRHSSRHAGLGLTITHRILELHGEEIHVTSELGVGTCFSFKLPVAKEQATA